MIPNIKPELNVECPNCKSMIVLSAEYAADTMHCSNCQGSFPVPDTVKAQLQLEQAVADALHLQA